MAGACASAMPSSTEVQRGAVEADLLPVCGFNMVTLARIVITHSYATFRSQIHLPGDAKTTHNQ